MTVYAEIGDSIQIKHTKYEIQLIINGVAISWEYVERITIVIDGILWHSPPDTIQTIVKSFKSFEKQQNRPHKY